MPISADPAAKSLALEKRLGITAFDLYSDHDGAASRAWDIYDEDTEIALAATFVVDRGGKVLYRYVGADKADRPSIDAILSAVQ